jgi:hypothetical protein
MTKIMDNRKQNIKELESKKQEAQKSADQALEQIGERTLIRMMECKTPPIPESADYRRLLQDIAESEAYIAAVEQDMLRLKILQETITEKEQDRSSLNRELADCYVRLGENLLDHHEFDYWCSSYKQQIELLVPKIRSLEDRLEKLEDMNSDTVFSWIGKNAQSMVIHSLLNNSQESLRRIYESLGEGYMRSESGFEDETILTPLRIIRDLQKGSSELMEELAALKAAYRKIGDAFGADGNPHKRIQDMEKHIARIKGELKILYLRVGTHAAADGFAPLLPEEDAPLLAEIKKFRQIQTDIEAQIEKISVSIIIDGEKVNIRRFQKAIAYHRRRIAVSEQAITALEERIAKANQRIEDLTQQL